MLIATNKKHFAYLISSKLRSDEAIATFKKLYSAGIPSLYIFRASDNDNYIVQYEGISEGELHLNLRILQNKLEKFGDQNLKIVDLTDSTFCGRNGSICKRTEMNSTVEINYIICK